jgi:hypothetical protein
MGRGKSLKIWEGEIRQGEKKKRQEIGRGGNEMQRKWDEVNPNKGSKRKRLERDREKRENPQKQCCGSGSGSDPP